MTNTRTSTRPTPPPARSSSTSSACPRPRSSTSRRARLPPHPDRRFHRRHAAVQCRASFLPKRLGDTADRHRPRRLRQRLIFAGDGGGGVRHVATLHSPPTNISLSMATTSRRCRSTRATSSTGPTRRCGCGEGVAELQRRAAVLPVARRRHAEARPTRTRCTTPLPRSRSPPATVRAADVAPSRGAVRARRRPARLPSPTAFRRMSGGGGRAGADAAVGGRARRQRSLNGAGAHGGAECGRTGAWRAGQRELVLVGDAPAAVHRVVVVVVRSGVPRKVAHKGVSGRRGGWRVLLLSLCARRVPSPDCPHSPLRRLMPCPPRAVRSSSRSSERPSSSRAVRQGGAAAAAQQGVDAIKGSFVSRRACLHDEAAPRGGSPARCRSRRGRRRRSSSVHAERQRGGACLVGRRGACGA